MTPLEPQRARLVQVADVYKAGRLAAQLRRTPLGTEFAYLPAYLEDGTPVATTLPLSDEPRITPAASVPPFFAGLLPEGRRLTGLRRLVKTSADDELSVLLAVGRDPVGNVQVVPEGESPDPAEALVVVESSFEEIRFAEILADAGVIDPVAIPGVQDKASARVISTPLGVGSDRFILKIDPPEYPHLVENEHYFLTLASRLGIPTVESDLVHDADGRVGLLVRRFDRVLGPNDTTSALACEDACQLLDRWPGDKYNVTSEQVVAALRSVCAAAPVAARDAFRQLCFAWLTGNGDVNAKNISVLASPDGEWRVAPAYDLPSTVPYGDSSLALPLNGVTTGVSRQRLLTFADEIGLTNRAAEQVLDGLLKGTDGLADDIKAGAISFDQNTTDNMVRELRYRRRQLL